MYLDCTCVNISEKTFYKLIKGKRLISYNFLVNKIKKELPELYNDLDLSIYNPYHEDTYSTKEYYILTHSAIEYFIKK